MIRNLSLALLVAAACFPLGGASGCDESINNDDVTLAVTTRGSISTLSVEGNDNSTSAVISGDGRFLAFASVSTSLVSNPVSGVYNIYVRDLGAQTTELVSVTPGGAGGSAASSAPSISSDGRYVVFTSLASDLVTGLDDPVSDVFLRDRQAGTTVRISQTSAGGVANGASSSPRISPDGRFIVFESAATNLEGTPDTNGVTDIFLLDLQSSTMERVSLTASGGIPSAASSSPGVSADGRYVVYHSSAADMVTGDLGTATDVFIRDRQLARTERVSVAFPFGDPNANSTDASISHDGRYVSFTSAATNLTSGTDVNGSFTDIYVRDLIRLSTQVVSRSTTGALAFGVSSAARISGDGSRVTFQSDAPNLVDGDTNGVVDVFLRDFASGITQRVSVRTFGVQASDRSESKIPSISTDGRTVAFESVSEDLVDDDTNGVSDVFVRTPLP